MSQVFVLRHAESEANAGLHVIDARLTNVGRAQAAKVGGHYNLVICSVMRRAKETLENSRITFDKVVYSTEAREMKNHIGDFLPGESRTPESVGELLDRLDNLVAQIYKYSKEYDKILIVSHYYTLMYLTSTNKDDLRSRRDFPNGLNLDNCEIASTML